MDPRGAIVQRLKFLTIVQQLARADMESAVAAVGLDALAGTLALAGKGNDNDETDHHVSRPASLRARKDPSNTRTRSGGRPSTSSKVTNYTHITNNGDIGPRRRVRNQSTSPFPDDEGIASALAADVAAGGKGTAAGRRSNPAAGMPKKVAGNGGHGQTVKDEDIAMLRLLFSSSVKGGAGAGDFKTLESDRPSLPPIGRPTKKRPDWDNRFGVASESSPSQKFLMVPEVGGAIVSPRSRQKQPALPATPQPLNETVRQGGSMPVVLSASQSEPFAQTTSNEDLKGAQSSLNANNSSTVMANYNSTTSSLRLPAGVTSATSSPADALLDTPTGGSSGGPNRLRRGSGIKARPRPKAAGGGAGGGAQGIAIRPSDFTAMDAERLRGATPFSATANGSTMVLSGSGSGVLTSLTNTQSRALPPTGPSGSRMHSTGNLNLPPTGPYASAGTGSSSGNNETPLHLQRRKSDPQGLEGTYGKMAETYSSVPLLDEHNSAGGAAGENYGSADPTAAGSRSPSQAGGRAAASLTPKRSTPDDARSLQIAEDEAALAAAAAQARREAEAHHMQLIGQLAGHVDRMLEDHSIIHGRYVSEAERLVNERGDRKSDDTGGGGAVEKQYAALKRRMEKEAEAYRKEVRNGIAAVAEAQGLANAAIPMELELDRIQRRLKGIEVESANLEHPTNTTAGDMSDEELPRQPVVVTTSRRKRTGAIPQSTVSRILANKALQHEVISYNERLWNTSATSQFQFADRLSGVLLEDVFGEVCLEVDGMLNDYIEGLAEYELKL